MDSNLSTPVLQDAADGTSLDSSVEDAAVSAVTSAGNSMELDMLDMPTTVQQWWAKWMERATVAGDQVVAMALVLHACTAPDNRSICLAKHMIVMSCWCHTMLVSQHRAESQLSQKCA